MARNTSGLKRGGPGRPKGLPNRVTTEAKAACNQIVDDPTYRKNLTAYMKANAGHAGPLEPILWYYAKGKPKERVEIGADKSLAALITEAVMGFSREVEP